MGVTLYFSFVVFYVILVAYFLFYFSYLSFLVVFTFFPPHFGDGGIAQGIASTRPTSHRGWMQLGTASMT
jgi:hypothetical protein